MIRREPPPFRRAEIVRTERRTPFLVRVTLGGDELVGLPPGEPAASVRLLLPEPDGLVLPTWTGNEFLLPDGRRPLLRTVTPLHAAGRELVVDVVRHTSPLTRWADAGVGTAVAVSGTGRGTTVDPEVRSWLLLGDESAVPAISTVLAALPPTAAAEVVVEVRADEARSDLPAPPSGSITWVVADPAEPPGSALVRAVERAERGPGTHVWAAGEAAAMQRIRQVVASDRDSWRPTSTIRGYWKAGRAGS